MIMPCSVCLSNGFCRYALIKKGRGSCTVMFQKKLPGRVVPFPGNEQFQEKAQKKYKKKGGQQ